MRPFIIDVETPRRSRKKDYNLLLNLLDSRMFGHEWEIKCFNSKEVTLAPKGR